MIEKIDGFEIYSNEKSKRIINIDIDEYINSYAKNFFIRNEKIFCINNKSIVDKVLLFENLSDDLNYLAKKLNLNSNLVLEYKNIRI